MLLVFSYIYVDFHVPVNDALTAIYFVPYFTFTSIYIYSGRRDERVACLFSVEYTRKRLDTQLDQGSLAYGGRRALLYMCIMFELYPMSKPEFGYLLLLLLYLPLQNIT